MTFDFSCITMTHVLFPPHIHLLMKKPFTFVCVCNALKISPAGILHWIVVRNVVQVTFCMTDSHCHWMIVFSVLLQVRFVEHWVAGFAHSVPALPLAHGGFQCTPIVLVCYWVKRWETQCNGYPSSPSATLLEFTVLFFRFFSHICYFPHSYSLRTNYLGISDALTLEAADLLSRKLVPTYINTFY